MSEKSIARPDQIPSPSGLLSRKKGPDWMESRGKRMFDLAVAVPMLTVAVPVEIVARTAIRVEERKENREKRRKGEKIELTVFYSERVGTRGEAIRVKKIRTMKKCFYPESDFATNTPEDENGQVTRVGRFLRKHDLDEMPQVWQVAKGEMTMFGHARPVLQSDLDVLYGENGHIARLSTKEIEKDRVMRKVGKPALVVQSVVYDRNGMRTRDETMGYEWNVNYFENASLGRDLRLFGRESSQKVIRAVKGSYRYGRSKMRRAA